MENNIQAFLKVLDASDNSTGGGSASSIAGAMAAGLVGMVARLSMGKEDLGPTDHFSNIASQAVEISRKLFDGAHTDSEAFSVVSSAYKMPKTTDDEKQARSRAIQDGMVHCSEVPLANAQLCREVIDLAAALERSFNTNAESDLQCGQYLAAAGLKGCAANVRINIPYIKDKKTVVRLEAELGEILSGTQID
jgi:formiminotetrahydrofolate cyclodeaminase